MAKTDEIHKASLRSTFGSDKISSSDDIFAIIFKNFQIKFKTLKLKISYHDTLPSDTKRNQKMNEKNLW